METQVRNFEWKTAIGSFDHAKANQGLISSGVYKGFDTIADGGGVGINITISHSGDGFKFVESDLTESAESGIVVTPQGKIIHIVGTPNAIPISDGGGNDRIDYLILEHEHIEITGGSPAIFSVIEGPTDGSEPVLSNPLKQVLLTKINVPSGATTFAALTFEFPTQPNFAGLTGVAFLNVVQQFTKTQALQKEGTVVGTTQITGDVNTIHLQLNSDGNYYVLPDWGNTNSLSRITFEDIDGNYPPIGTEITLKASHTFNGVSREDIDEDAGFIDESNMPSTTLFQFQAGDVFKVRYEGLDGVDHKWRLIMASHVAARVASTVENEVDVVQGQILTIQSDIAAIQDRLNDLTTIRFSSTNSTLLSPNTGSINSGWDSSSHMIAIKEDIIIVDINATLDISGTPTELSFDMSSFIDLDSYNLPFPVSLALEETNGKVVTLDAIYGDSRIRMRNLDGGAFPSTTIIKGQIILTGTTV